MGLFNRKKKNQDKSKNQPAANASPAPSGGRAKKRKYHSKRKKSNLVSDMKISGSVPTTIIDAIHGDKSIISSDRDFVRAEKVNINGKVYYPVFVIDEDTMEKSGIASSANRKVYGQLSTGLKTSSGATGLLPIVTPQSEQQDYFAILPMHDAFDFLNSQAVFADYTDGWPVGLLNIDNDELSLQKTDTRLTMSQWVEYIEGKLHFKYEGGQLRFSNDVPTTSDPLAFQGAEDGTSAPTPADNGGNGDPFDEFDEPDNAQINQSNSSAPDNQPSTPPASDNDAGGGNPVADSSNSQPDFDHRNGYGIDDLPPEDDESTPQPAPQSAPDSAQNNQEVLPQPAPQNASEDNGDEVTPQFVNQHPVQTEVSPQPISNSDTNVADAPAPESKPAPQPQEKTLQSRDELEADNLTLSASVRTLNDLKISISDREFVDAYMKPLKITPIPLADESTDPTGRIHHLNELRRQANVELTSAEKTVRSRLRQWFETQRAGELDALNQGVRDNGSQINQKRDQIKRLRDNLNDTTGLRSLAETDLQADLDRMDAQYQKEFQNAKDAAILEVENQFTEKQSQNEQRKKEMIASRMAEQRDMISKQINAEKVRIQQIAQTAALQGYTQIMKLGAAEFRNSQQALDKLHRSLLARLDQYERQSRDEENRRVVDQADIARNDTTITTLREQLTQADNQRKVAIEKQEQQYQQKLADSDRRLEAFKRKLESDKQAELSKMADQVKVAQNQADEASKRLTSQQVNYQQMLQDQKQQQDADTEKKVQDIRDAMKQSNDANNQAFHRFKLMLIGSVAFAVFFGGILGFAIGVVNSYGGNKQTTQAVSPTVAYSPQLAPTVQSSSSSSASSSSESSVESSSSHSSSSKDSHHQTVKDDKKNTNDKK